MRLTVDGRVEESQVEVRRNPWITDVTDEDLVAQYEFGMRIRDQVDAAILGGDRDPRGEGAAGRAPGGGWR